MTIGDMITLIMLYGKDNDWIFNASVSVIDCDNSEICIFPSGGRSIVISKSDYLKEEE